MSSNSSDHLRRQWLEKNEKLLCMDKQRCGVWAGEFRFVQLADTQLGLLPSLKKSFWAKWADWIERWTWIQMPVLRDSMPALSVDEAYEEEMAMARRTVQAINAMDPSPAFVVVCGDMVNAYPATGTSEDAMNTEQVRDFQRIYSAIRDDTPLVCVCGNHDVGNDPTAASLSTYRSQYGPDYFSFWVHGVKFLVLNSQLWKSSKLAEEETARQDTWLTEELQDNGFTHLVVFTHIPLFISSPDEPNGYFNIAKEVRGDLLRRLYDAGCRYVFSGHYHANAGGFYQDLELVVSAAVGTNITRYPERNQLDLPAMKGGVLDTQSSGLRIVTVGEQKIIHEWLPLATFEES